MSEVERPFIVKQSGTVPVTTLVPAFTWRCELCGWLGLGHLSERVAEKEAAAHLWDEHGVVVCDPERLDGLHVWKRVPGTDSTDQCERCGRFCGK